MGFEGVDLVHHFQTRGGHEHRGAAQGGHQYDFEQDPRRCRISIPRATSSAGWSKRHETQSKITRRRPGDCRRMGATAQIVPVTLTTPTSQEIAPDADGFIPRWFLLEPIESNGLTDRAVQAAVKREYFPNQLTVIPRAGDKVTVGDAQLTWHAVDTKLYNVNLYHFAHGLGRPPHTAIGSALEICLPGRAWRCIHGSEIRARPVRTDSTRRPAHRSRPSLGRG